MLDLQGLPLHFYFEGHCDPLNEKSRGHFESLGVIGYECYETCIYLYMCVWFS